MATSVSRTSIVTPTIAVEILKAHEAAHGAARSALEHARRAGELLTEAKQNVEHGQWLPWLAEHLPALAERTVQGYMKVAARWPELEKRNGVADLPLRDALKMLAEPRVKPASDTTAVVTTENTTALLKLRGDLSASRNAKHRASRILEITTEQATNICDTVTDYDTGQIKTSLLAATEPTLRLVWARELRLAAAQIMRLARALEECGR